MKKDRNISIRVDGELWESFKAAATARTTSAADAIDTLMRDYLDMPSQSLPIDLADRLGIVEARLDTLESKAIEPIQNIRRGVYRVEPVAIEPSKSVPRASNGKINIVELSKSFGCKDTQICRWVRGSVSNSPARIAFDRWCEANPAAHRELIDRFTSS